ncbi:hypothetical protein RHSIM_Rhsim07G0088800 [Rhododendron simsii]|uniref:RRM domain-containing protein n=1 Tax=Rhododendron simsii TaxID=118357 RepID=A0A834LJ08_RHOSS|nr:hypothetical protein RHSIM_Rhsim07G0088800 [Rhododendron simsii]
MSYSRQGRSGSPPDSRSPTGDRRSRSLSRSRRNRSRSNDSDAIANPGNNLYVTGLSTRVTTSALEKYFNNEGKVTDCHLVTDPRTKESRGFAFVTMETNEDANRCIKYLNRSVLEGRLITVDKVWWVPWGKKKENKIGEMIRKEEAQNHTSSQKEAWEDTNSWKDATRGSHVVILLADGMREIAEEDRAPPMTGGSMFPPTLIGSTGNVPCQLVVVAIGEHNYKSIAKSHHTNGNRYSRLVMVAARNRCLLGYESSCPFVCVLVH